MLTIWLNYLVKIMKKTNLEFLVYVAYALIALGSILGLFWFCVFFFIKKDTKSNYVIPPKNTKQEEKKNPQNKATQEDSKNTKAPINTDKEVLSEAEKEKQQKEYIENNTLPHTDSNPTTLYAGSSEEETKQSKLGISVKTGSYENSNETTDETQKPKNNAEEDVEHMDSKNGNSEPSTTTEVQKEDSSTKINFQDLIVGIQNQRDVSKELQNFLDTASIEEVQNLKTFIDTQKKEGMMILYAVLIDNKAQSMNLVQSQKLKQEQENQPTQKQDEGKGNNKASKEDSNDASDEVNTEETPTKLPSKKTRK